MAGWDDGWRPLPPGEGWVRRRRLLCVCVGHSQVYPDQKVSSKTQPSRKHFPQRPSQIFPENNTGLGVRTRPAANAMEEIKKTSLFYNVLLSYSFYVDYIDALSWLRVSVQIYVLLFNLFEVWGCFRCDFCVCMPRKNSSITGIIFWCTGDIKPTPRSPCSFKHLVTNFRPPHIL